MSRKKLADILTPDPAFALQWEAVVPIATNPFIMAEVCQMAFAASAAGLIIMATGIWIVGGGLAPGDLSVMLQASAVFFIVIVAAFLVIALVFFRNRYYALYSFTPQGIHHEGTRGRAEIGTPFTWSLRPESVQGYVFGKSTRAKDLPWDKIDRFIDFPSMRSIQLKRGRWHLLRLYTPDSETHERVVAYLAERLRETGA